MQHSAGVWSDHHACSSRCCIMQGPDGQGRHVGRVYSVAAGCHTACKTRVCVVSGSIALPLCLQLPTPPFPKQNTGSCSPTPPLLPLTLWSVTSSDPPAASSRADTAKLPWYNPLCTADLQDTQRGAHHEHVICSTVTLGCYCSVTVTHSGLFTCQARSPSPLCSPMLPLLQGRLQCCNGSNRLAV